MSESLGNIFRQREDYKICVCCKAINSHVNEECHFCGNASFSCKDAFVKNAIEAKYISLKKEGYEADKIDDIYIEV